MHGNIWNIIKDKIKNQYRGKNIKWFVLVTREKTFRLLLFLLILRRSSIAPNELFINPIKLRIAPKLSEYDLDRFKKWIRLGQVNELGRPENYEIRTRFRNVQL